MPPAASAAPAPAAPGRPLRIAFLHPDLGIGGAERLVVDAALALQECGHLVDIFTSHHDPAHCFEETRNGTLRVFVSGDHLPRSFFGAGAILCAILRNLWAGCSILSSWCDAGPQLNAAGTAPLPGVPLANYDVFFVDQLSIALPLLCAAPATARSFFYCHFPDQLLTRRTSLLKRLYRLPFDVAEELTTGAADAIVVNSRFTAQTYAATFARLAARGPRCQPAVLYPSINFARYDDNRRYDVALAALLGRWAVETGSVETGAVKTGDADALAAFIARLEAVPAPLPTPLSNSNNNNNNKTGDVVAATVDLDTAFETQTPLSAFVFLSINRYERKKDIGVAVRAFALAKAAGALPSRAAPAVLHTSDGFVNGGKNNIDNISGGSAGVGVVRRVFTSARLVVAGGFDPRVEENFSHHAELRALATSLGLTVTDYPYLPPGTSAAAVTDTAAAWDAAADVVFVRSFTEPQRQSLLRRAQAVLYTPTGEHFGIVPVESMFARRPVVACASGGPLESVATSLGTATGVLCTPGSAESFAEAMGRLARSTTASKSESESSDVSGSVKQLSEVAAMGDRGPAHVQRLFSFDTFKQQLQGHVLALAADGARAAAKDVGAEESGSYGPALRRAWARLGSSPRGRLAAVGVVLGAVFALLFLLFAVVLTLVLSALLK